MRCVSNSDTLRFTSFSPKLSPSNFCHSRYKQVRTSCYIEMFLILEKFILGWMEGGSKLVHCSGSSYRCLSTIPVRLFNVLGSLLDLTHCDNAPSPLMPDLGLVLVHRGI